jgi:hypothetical protein
MRKKYWAVCYGGHCRWAGPFATQEEAVWDAFGVRLAQLEGLTRSEEFSITVREFPKNPKYMPLKDRTPFLEALYARHKEKTGNEIK